MKEKRNLRKQRITFIFCIIASCYDTREDDANMQEMINNCFLIVYSNVVDIQISYVTENTHY